MPFLDIFGQEFLKPIVIFEISTLKFVYLQNFTEKQKCLNLGPKTPDLGILGWNLKTILSYLKSAPSNLSDCKILRKNKSAWIWDQKYLVCVFLGKNFKNTIVIFEISTLEFVCLQNFTEKQKCLNLWPKKTGLGILGLEFENNIVIFEISTLKFV